MNITETRHVSDETLVEAIAIITSPVFGALSMTNAVGGYLSDTWRVVRAFTPTQMVDEAVRRDVDLSAVKTACCEVLVFDTPVFHGAVGYDPRPRCPLCTRVHFKPNDGSELSCGDAAGFRNKPTWHWTRASTRAAIETTTYRTTK